MQVGKRIEAAWSFIREVQRRAGQVRAPQLVAAITMRFLTSLVPLLIGVVSVVGLVAKDQADFGDRVLDNLKLEDQTVRDVFQGALDQAGSGAGFALAVSIVGSLFTGLGVIQAVATACDAVWQVPTRGLIDKLLGIPWLLGAIAILVASGFATSLTKVVDSALVGYVSAIAGAALAGTLLVLLTHRMLTNVKIPWRAHVPGAMFAGLVLALFQVVGTIVVTRVLDQANGVYGSVAGFFALITVLSIFGNIIVYGAVFNVVRWEARFGTTEMVGRAPRLPVDHFAELERGGQRPHPAAGAPLMRAAKFITRRK